MAFTILPVPHDKPITWSVVADGVPVCPRHLEISSDYGTFTFGWRPEGFNGWAFKPGKGGAMTMPWSRTLSGDILIGLIHEHRPNMGPEKIWGVLSGFVEIGESAEEGQRRESLEEGGLDTTGAKQLAGLPINSDRLYLVQDANQGEGMVAFEIEVPFQRLEQSPDGLWRPERGLIDHARESDMAFMPWKDAILASADSLALAGIARLLRNLL